MPKIGIDEAVFVSLFCECILYGVFVATFGECLRALVWRSGTFQAAKNVRRTFIAVTWAFCIIATFDLIISLIHVLDAFIHYGGPGGPKKYLSNLPYWINVTKGILVATQIIIGDAVLIYRTYIIYNRRYYITLPLCVLWVGVAATSFGIPIVEATIDVTQPESLVAGRLNAWTNSVTACEFSLNIVGTALIAYRIWSTSRQAPALPCDSHGPQRRMKYALRIIIESALIYTSASVVLLGASIAKSNVQYIGLGILVPLIGICFNLIIVRVNWRYQRDIVAAPLPVPPSDPESHAHRGLFGIPVHLAHLAKEKTMSNSSGDATSTSEPVQVSMSQRIEYDGGSSLGTTNTGNSCTRQMWSAT